MQILDKELRIAAGVPLESAIQIAGMIGTSRTEPAVFRMEVPGMFVVTTGSGIPEPLRVTVTITPHSITVGTWERTTHG